MFPLSRSAVSNCLWTHGLYLPGSSVHEISQVRYWHGLLCPTPRDLPNKLPEKPQTTNFLLGMLFCMCVTDQMPMICKINAQEEGCRVKRHVHLSLIALNVYEPMYTLMGLTIKRSKNASTEARELKRRQRLDNSKRRKWRFWWSSSCRWQNPGWGRSRELLAWAGA